LKRTVMREDPKVKIPVEHPGVLEVPEGKNVEDLPYSHFAALAKKKGFGEISKALTNLHTWNKTRDPKLSNWADDMQAKLSKEFKKSESQVQEKWEKDVDVKSTGEYADKTEAELKAAIEALKGKPGDNKKKMGQLLFALRAKQGWKKKTGA